MSLQQRRHFLATACMASLGTTSAFAASPFQGAFESQQRPASLILGGVEYLHRGSRAGQHAFTPRSDVDLGSWHDMLTVNMQDTALDGEQLAVVANLVQAAYQQHGKILKTTSRPRSRQRNAEHFMVALLGQSAFLEAVFTRLVLVDGRGCSIVYSHRIYGQTVGPAMSQWLQTRGSAAEQALMAWDAAPMQTALRSLPQTSS